MGLGIRKTIVRFNVFKDNILFSYRNFLFGFDYAAKKLITVNKQSIIPLLRKFGAKIGKNCDIETPLIFHNCANFNNLSIDDNCHIGKNCFFDLREKIMIEDNVVISMQTTILTHQDLTKSNLSKLYPSKSKAVLIKNNSYIGANSVILMGVILNEGSFVAAGSVVIKDVLTNTMVGGVPAKLIKQL